jgi:flavin-dependent dehydrogenase
VRRVEVAVVGGGPAGATVAAHLARRGREVMLLERSPAWRWRACGVFTSPAAVTALRRVGLAEDVLRSAALPIGAMRVEAADGTAFRLTYGDDGRLDRSAVGFDRRVLDEAMVDLARAAGADVRTGASLTGMRMDASGHRLAVRDADGPGEVQARVLVGADGVRSTVARLTGVARPARLGARVGLTFHVRDPRPLIAGRDARMVVGEHGYCGLAPIPGGRVNVGIVLVGDAWRRRLAADGAAAVVSAVLAAIPRAPDDAVDWAAAERLDPIEGAAPLGHRVARRSGPGWLLVGDAAGFLDPLTGEGLHRALVSAALAASAVDAHLAGDPGALTAYDRAMSRRFRAKDLVTLLVQGFAARPALFQHAARRLAHRSELRETMGLVMGDLVPATRALEPAFLAGILGPIGR